MDYIYQLQLKKQAKHCVIERFALPTWNAHAIEQSIFNKFAKYRIQYYVGIEPSYILSVFGFHIGKYKIIKIGISRNPTQRIKRINANWKSGYTEYLELPPFAYFCLLTNVFWKWFVWTIFLPAFMLALTVVLILFLKIN